MFRSIKDLAAIAGAGVLSVLAVMAFDQPATAQRAARAYRARSPAVPRSGAVFVLAHRAPRRPGRRQRLRPAPRADVLARRSPTTPSSASSSATPSASRRNASRARSAPASSSSPDGIVVTNTHVIRGRGETEIRIALSDKREFDAKVVSQDDKTDIAILKIEHSGQVFPTLQLEDSDNLEVGDMVLAIGNPFGVGQTVTSGIVSALARSEVGTSDLQVFIQTDAAINPGNSGGALVDMSGKLVGINTMIFSQSGGSQGIGFAIPSTLSASTSKAQRKAARSNARGSARVLKRSRAIWPKGSVSIASRARSWRA